MFFILKRIQKDIFINVKIPSRKVPVILIELNETNFLKTFSKNNSSTKFNQNSFNWSRVVPCERTEAQTDGRTGRQAVRQTDRQTVSQSDRQTDRHRQTDRQTEMTKLSAVLLAHLKISEFILMGSYQISACVLTSVY
jgi:hypothetical protein